MGGEEDHHRRHSEEDGEGELRRAAREEADPYAEGAEDARQGDIIGRPFASTRFARGSGGVSVGVDHETRV